MTTPFRGAADGDGVEVLYDPKESQMEFSPLYARLEGYEVVPMVSGDDVRLWGQNWDAQNRRVAETWIGQIRVSTVFLGINHQFGDGPPLWFETMVFYRSLSDLDQCRYATWEDAARGHEGFVVYYSPWYVRLRVFRDWLVELVKEKWNDRK